MKKSYEIIVHGRGGQGGKTTAELITQAAAREDKFVQAFPEFGPERSGAPMRAFVRVSNEPIRTHQAVCNPDCILILDDTLLDSAELQEDLSPGWLAENGMVVINSRKSVEEIKQKLQQPLEVVAIDASGISNEIIGEARPNVAILGKFAQATKVVEAEDIVAVFREKYLPKIGRERTEKNVKAILQSAKS